MKITKHFPPHLSQLVFLNLDGEIEKINGLDYDLFIWLIYKTHKHYHKTKDKTKDNYIKFEYKDIKESIPTKPNTNSIQSSLIKINEIQLLSNYLNSYENKEIILTTQPFKINIEVSDNGKSYGFSVTTSKKFLQRFDNPTPKVSVDYTIIYNLNKMSKLLYLFLKDALGVYENKNRKVDVDNLRHMMNVGNDFTSHSNFITQLKKSIKDINEFSDIYVGYKVIKKRNLKSGKSEIISIKFTISKDELKLQKQRVIDTQSIEKETIVESVETVETQTATDTVTVVPTKTFDKYIDELVESEYQRQKSYGREIKNPKSYKNTIRKKMIDDIETKSQFELVSYLDGIKSDFRKQINDNKNYMLILQHKTDIRNNLYFINDTLMKYAYDHSISAHNISEVLDFIQNDMDDYCFSVEEIINDDVKFDVGRL